MRLIEVDGPFGSKISLVADKVLWFERPGQDLTHEVRSIVMMAGDSHAKLLGSSYETVRDLLMAGPFLPLAVPSREDALDALELAERRAES